MTPNLSGRSARAAMAKRYSASLVGEQHYRAAVAKARKGDRVTIDPEPDNAFDPKALVVRNHLGETLGYIPRDSFLQRSIHQKGTVWNARILRAYQDDAFRQIRIEVTTGTFDDDDDDDEDDDDPVQAQPPPRRTPPSRTPSQRRGPPVPAFDDQDQWTDADRLRAGLPVQRPFPNTIILGIAAAIVIIWIAVLASS